jgi:hypothetical protein
MEKVAQLYLGYRDLLPKCHGHCVPRNCIQEENREKGEVDT